MNDNRFGGSCLNRPLLILDLDEPGSPSLIGDGGNGNDHGALIQFWGGAYNANGDDGIRLRARSNFIEAGIEEGPGFFGFLGASLHDVVAVANGDDGLDIQVFDGLDLGLRPDVEIIRGVYNVNGDDGIFVRDLGQVLVYKATVVANHGDGIHSVDNLDLDVVESVVVANQGENIRIEF